ncbi:MAG: DUF2325 domain-containing protein [Lactobacillus sp.]|jgi:hypothetical protein|nr:DUF2325 domain-containing protein [Lactobacillus sp.]MCH4068958.1 DUF2325 domain-containing protein [Lactobacillus sp.]MCI1303360.1 DUF2325 domain-containing protein [Lactobacillus sp.]MCI1329436.1 DUF2325 domain-containing protein [Lactobacillus sp.]MCI1359612.1 DUF2325 domain-containing protein [Lactobacillus sp.]
MFDYRNSLKRILQNTDSDERSLQNSLAAIKVVLGMANADAPKAAPNKAQPRRPKQSTPTNSDQLSKLLAGITALIEQPGSDQAKEQSLRALRKLTFEPAFGQRYGQQLASLETAIQHSTTTVNVINQQTFEKALKPKKLKRDYRKGERYTVIRLLIGADLINQNDEVVYHVTEGQIHSLNLRTGDIVEALPLPADSGFEAEVLRIVGHRKLSSSQYDQIDVFRFGVVRKNGSHYSVMRNVKGEKLRVRGKDVIATIDGSLYQTGPVNLEDGSIVDLVWYHGDVRLKSDPAAAIQIRWIYEVDQPAPKRQLKRHRQHKQTNLLPTLDLNLHYQRVGIAIGGNQNEAILDGIVEKYHGVPIPIDAFQGKKKVIEQQVKDLDIVILVTALAAHDATWNISEFATKYHVKFAVASSKGYQAFERALYRADKGLPAYEGNQQINYQIRNS